MKKEEVQLKSSGGKNIKLIGQYIKDLSFENFAAQSGTLSRERKNIDMDLNLSRKKLNDNVFEVTLNFLVDANISNKKIFLLELSYASLYEIRELSKKEELKKTLLVDCPNIMFPFLRQIVFNITRESGLSPVNLDFINFDSLYNGNKN